MPFRMRDRWRGMPGLWIAHGIVTAMAVALCAVPLFGVFGFEFGAAIGWLLTYVTAFRACGAAARARATAPSPFPGRALLDVLATNATLLAGPLVVAAVHSHWAPTCNAREGLAFYSLFAVPALFYGTSLGFGLGLTFTARRARLAFVLWSLVTYAHTGWVLLTQPPKFSYNAFIGYFPGPLYDTELHIGTTLLVARAVVILQAFVVIGVAVLGWHEAIARWRPVPRGWRDTHAPLAVLVLGCAASLGLIWAFRAPIGLQIDRAYIQKTLGGRIETPHCVVYFDKTAVTPAQSQRLAAEHEMRWQQLAQFFGVHPTRKIGCYVYANAAQKKRLMGAAGTSFEDVLNDEFHINASNEEPHPALTHEMAHVFAAQISRWVPVQWKIGIHEGIAVAAEWDEESTRLEMTPHQACAAMDSLRLLPDLRRSLSAFGFWTQSGSRVYTACGSFIRWLVDTRGMERFQRLWRRGSFESAYSETLDALLVQWQKELASTPIERREMRRAERLFRPGSVFTQPCAHEQASLESRAATALAGGDAAGAESLYVRLVAIEPDDATHGVELGRARLHRGDAAGALEAARRVVESPKSSPGLVDRAWRLTGDASWLGSEGGASQSRTTATAADSAYAKAERLATSTADRRALEVVVQVRADPRLSTVLRDYLIDRGLPSEAGLAALAAARVAAPEAGLPRYLIGRRLVYAASPTQAVPELEAALEAGGLSPETVFTARELLGRARLETGDPQGAAHEFETLLQVQAPEWRRLGWQDWLHWAKWEIGAQGAP